jgi:pimeloyl-ACP methyl ester carboxylesterase
MTSLQPLTERRVDRVRSADGTLIAFETLGDGPPLILVDPALLDRGMGQSRAMARLLAPHFTVFVYDRRGRGERGNTLPYAVDREIDDLAALLQVAGDSVGVWGMSSGAMLALEAARQLPDICKIALYEPPLVVDATRPPMAEQWAAIDEAVASRRNGTALKIFLRMVGVPAPVVFAMHLTPMWRKLERLASALPYDGMFVREYQRGRPLPNDRWQDVRIPALVTDGGKSPTWMRHGTAALAKVLPNATYRTLEGQTHRLVPKAHAAMLIDFFSPAEQADR